MADEVAGMPSEESMPVVDAVRERALDLSGVSDRSVRDQKRVAAGMLAAGLSPEAVAGHLGVKEGVLREWIKDFPDVVKMVHEGVKARAVLERGSNLRELIRIRDHGAKDADRISAIQDIEAKAGVVTSNDPQTKQPVVVVLGQQVSVTDMRGAELMELLREASRKAGPEVEGVVNAKFPVRVVASEDRAGGSGGVEAGDGAAHGAGAGQEEAGPSQLL